MRRIKIVLLAALLTLSVVSVALFIWGRHLGPDAEHLISALPSHVDMLLSGVNYTEVSQGRREWILEAETLRYFKARELLVFDGVHMTLFSDEEGQEIRVTGETAYYDKKDKQVRLIGRVRARDTKGYHLSARELRYDVKKREVFAPGQFKLTGPKLDLDGRGLVMDMEQDRLEVLSEARVLIKSTRNLL